MEKFNKVIFYGALAITVVSALPLASNRPETWSLFSLLIGILLCLRAITLCFDQSLPSTFFARISLPAILYLIPAVWAILQATPFSDTLAHPIWLEAHTVLGADVKPTISVDPEATFTALMRYLSYGALFFIAASYGHASEKVYRSIKVFIVASAIYALYGVIVFFAGNETILWYTKWAYLGDLTSTFVNRNNYATFAGIGIVCTLAMTLRHVRALGRQSFRQMIQDVTSREGRVLWFYLWVMFVLTTALFLTHSRGGFLSTLLGMIVMVSLFAIVYGSRKTTRRALLFIPLGLLAYVFIVSSDVVMARLFSTTLANSVRDDVYLQVWEGIKTAPWLGFGYGTFEEAFKFFYTLPISLFNWDKAHNSYLELIFELGIPAAACLFASVIVLSITFARGAMKRRRDRILPVLGLAVTILVSAHAIVDFSLQIPAVAWTYALLAGLIWGQSWPSRGRRSRTNA